MTSFLLKCLDITDHEHFSGRLSIGGMPLGWVHFLLGYDHLRTSELSCWGFAKMLERLDGLAAVIDRWSWLLVVNEWNAAWTVEPSSFCVSVSHYKISCHPIILIWQSVLVWFIYFFFWFRVFFWPPKNWDKNKLLEMVPSQLEKYQTVTES